MVGTLFVGTGATVHASPGDAAASEPTVNRPCGYSTDPPNPVFYWAYWRNCSQYNDMVEIHRVWWTSRFVCVRANTTMQLGEAGSRLGDIEGATLRHKLCYPPDN